MVRLRAIFPFRPAAMDDGVPATPEASACSAGSGRQAYGKMACVMVGLPARGKTYIAQKLARYLNWLGVSTRVFNVGDYRRRLCGAAVGASFFDAHNADAERQRQEAARAALDDMLEWLCGAYGQVAIYDATNTTSARRRWVHDACQARGVGVLFVESICNAEEVVRANIAEVKLSSPDYAGAASPDDAVADFCNRIAHYAAVYEPLGGASAVESAADVVGSESEVGESGRGPAAHERHAYSYVQLVDAGARVVLNRIADYRQSRAVYFLLNLHIAPRSIYVARHGETTLNAAGRIGGDGRLSAAGERFAALLPALMRRIHGPGEVAVWTSAMARTVATARHLPYEERHAWRALNEIDAGACEGRTYTEIARDFPEAFAARDRDKFRFRYAGGESYADLVSRLEPIIVEAERAGSLLIVAHQAVLRAVLAYFLDRSPAELPYIRVPLHAVVQLTPRAYGCAATAYCMDICAADTHRPCPGDPSAGDLGSAMRVVRISASDLEADDGGL